MNWARTWLVRLAGLRTRRRRERELAAEIDSHVQLHVDDNLRTGMTEEQARRAALVTFGSIEAIREEYRDRLNVPWASVAGQALRQGLRSVLRHRAFTASVVLTLAIGVGAIAAMLGLVYALMFRPPDHVRAPERIVLVNRVNNYVEYRDLLARATALDLAAYTRVTMPFGVAGEVVSVEAECVTAGYFSLLGVQPAAGRVFAASDEPRGSAPTVIVSHGVWQRHFAREPFAAGRSVHVAGAPATVIGVAPPDFRGVEMNAVDIWVLLPVLPDACSFTGRNLLNNASGSWLTTIGRLRDGVSLTQAEASLTTLGDGDAAVRSRRGPALEPIHETRRDSVARDSRLALWLTAGAGLMLLIACANVAGLLSARAIERRREIAVRMQLGASRARVFLQMLAENLLLAAACGLVATLAAVWLRTLLDAFFPEGAHGGWIDPRMAAVLAGFALVAGVLSGLGPALQAVRVDVHAWRTGQNVATRHSRVGDALLVAQVALALVLAIGAGLFVQSVRQVKSGLGYDVDRVLVATLDLERAGIRRQAEQQAMFTAILERVQRAPGVEAASLTTSSPLGSGQFSVVLPDDPAAADGRETLPKHVSDVSADYFRTMGTRILQGRPFTASDAQTEPEGVIISANFAAEMWPGEDVTGRCKGVYDGQPCTVIVGVSESRRISSLTKAGGEIFSPLKPTSDSLPQALLVRPRGPVRDAIPVIKAAIRSVSPRLPIADVQALEDLANVRARSWRLGAAIFGLFGIAALLLAAVGLYAALAFAIRQRTAEIGVRMSLGAVPRDIAMLVIRRGVLLIGAGWITGMLAAVAAGGFIRGLLFGVAPSDASTFVVASLVLTAAGFAGCVVPALRATRVDPVVALRVD